MTNITINPYYSNKNKGKSRKQLLDIAIKACQHSSIPRALGALFVLKKRMDAIKGPFIQQSEHEKIVQELKARITELESDAENVDRPYTPRHDNDQQNAPLQTLAHQLPLLSSIERRGLHSQIRL